MALAFDAVSNSGALSTLDLSWTHTPVGTPRAVVVLILEAAPSGTDGVGAVTYGAVPMTQAPLSPFAGSAGAENAVHHAFHLGVGIPVGAQTVFVDSIAGWSKSAVAVTVTAAADTEVADTDAQGSASATTLTATLATIVETFVCASGFSGVSSPANMTWDAGETMLRELDNGVYVFEWARKTANPAPGAVSVTVNNNVAAGLGVFAVAIAEVAAGGDSGDSLSAAARFATMLGSYWN